MGYAEDLLSRWYENARMKEHATSTSGYTFSFDSKNMWDRIIDDFEAPASARSMVQIQTVKCKYCGAKPETRNGSYVHMVHIYKFTGIGCQNPNCGKPACYVGEKSAVIGVWEEKNAA